MKAINKCRCCNSPNIHLVNDFGKVPLADCLTETQELLEEFHLSTVFCEDCFHFQIRENIPPHRLFQNDYPYYSSKIPEVVKHFQTTFESITRRYTISSKDIIVEIAANDGVLISLFKQLTTNLISIEPSLPHAEITKENNIETINDFFSEELANNFIQEKQVYPKLIIACNVLAHTPSPISFIKGLDIISDINTRIIIEVPHSLPMIRNSTFDVIFHQHYSYFNLSTLENLFKRHGLYINSVEQISTQGGSLRLFISKLKKTDNSVIQILNTEKNIGLYNISIYKEFAQKIALLKKQTITLLDDLKSKNKTIIGYGAPGKSANYLNYFGINNKYLDALIDISPSKQGKYFPNTNLKIYPLDYLKENHIDYVLILVWNYSETIIENLSFLKEKGTKFILGFPEIKIL